MCEANANQIQKMVFGFAECVLQENDIAANHERVLGADVNGLFTFKIGMVHGIILNGNAHVGTQKCEPLWGFQFERVGQVICFSAQPVQHR